jgi:hypothetical protein
MLLWQPKDQRNRSAEGLGSLAEGYYALSYPSLCFTRPIPVLIESPVKRRVPEAPGTTSRDHSTVDAQLKPDLQNVHFAIKHPPETLALTMPAELQLELVCRPC